MTTMKIDGKIKSIIEDIDLMREEINKAMSSDEVKCIEEMLRLEYEQLGRQLYREVKEIPWDI